MTTKFKSGDLVTAKGLTEFEDDPAKDLKGVLEVLTYEGYGEFPGGIAYFIDGEAADPATIKTTEE